MVSRIVLGLSIALAACSAEQRRTGDGWTGPAGSVDDDLTTHACVDESAPASVRRYEALVGECAWIPEPDACDWLTEDWQCRCSVPTSPCNDYSDTDATLWTVCASGCTYSSLQSALDAIPSTLSERVVIELKTATYSTSAAYFYLTGKTATATANIVIQGQCTKGVRQLPRLTKPIFIHGVRFTLLDGLSVESASGPFWLPAVLITNHSDYTTVQDSNIKAMGVGRSGIIVTNSDYVHLVGTSLPQSGDRGLIVTCCTNPNWSCGPIVLDCAPSTPSTSDYVTVSEGSFCGNGVDGITFRAGRGHSIRGATITQNEGYGVVAFDTASLTVDTVLVGNNGTAGGFGILLVNALDATVKNCMVVENADGGIGIFGNSDRAHLWNNYVKDNFNPTAWPAFGIAAFNRGALPFFCLCDATSIPNDLDIQYNTIVNNEWNVAFINVCSWSCSACPGNGTNPTVAKFRSNIIVGGPYTELGMCLGDSNDRALVASNTNNLFWNNPSNCGAAPCCTGSCTGTSSVLASPLFTTGPRGAMGGTVSDGTCTFSLPITNDAYLEQDGVLPDSPAVNASGEVSTAACLTPSNCQVDRTTSPVQQVSCSPSPRGDCGIADIGYHYPICVREDPCPAGWGDCDGDASTGVSGCEILLLTSMENCGACGVTCPAAPDDGSWGCVDGRCVAVPP